MNAIYLVMIVAHLNSDTPLRTAEVYPYPTVAACQAHTAERVANMRHRYWNTQVQDTACLSERSTRMALSGNECGLRPGRAHEYLCDSVALAPQYQALPPMLFANSK